MTKQQLAIGYGGLLGMMCLILDSKTALSSAYEGLIICAKTLVPSLFPFFVFSIWMNVSFSGVKSRLLRPIGMLFRIPEGLESLLISAFLGGYPVGAQNIYSAYRNGCISKKEAERLLHFCSNAGPSFLFGIVAQMFREQKMVWVLWAIHVFSAWLVCRLVPKEDNSITSIPSNKASMNEMMHTSITAMAGVCGWVILFRVILGVLNRWVLWRFPIPVQVMITGLLELANGCCNLALVDNVVLRFLLCSGMLALGGVCVTMQTVSVIQELSIRPYLLGKILQCLCSVLLCFLYVTHTLLPFGIYITVFWMVRSIFQKLSGNPKKAVV